MRSSGGRLVLAPQSRQPKVQPYMRSVAARWPRRSLTTRARTVAVTAEGVMLRRRCREGFGGRQGTHRVGMLDREAGGDQPAGAPAEDMCGDGVEVLEQRCGVVGIHAHARRRIRGGLRESPAVVGDHRRRVAASSRKRLHVLRSNPVPGISRSGSLVIRSRRGGGRVPWAVLASWCYVGSAGSAGITDALPPAASTLRARG